MRRTKELQWRRYLLAGVVMIGTILLLALSSDRFSIVSHAESAAKVTATSANIRKEPSSSSATIGSTEKDKVISIKSQVQGADGYTWYEVYVDADTLGYIRSDLVQITDGTTPPTGTAPAAATAAPAAAATPVPDEPLVDVTAVNPASASVTGGDSVRIRQNASTTSRILNRVRSGMALTITGTANGKDGKVWYQVTYVADGTEVTGFIRSDYTTVKPEDLTPYTEEPSAEDPGPVEEPPADTEEPAPAGTEGYGAVLQDGKWWLVDYEGKHSDVPGQGFEIEEMFNAVKQNKTLLEESEKTVKTQKIILIILVILLLGAAAAITLLIFKVKDMTDAQYFNEVEKDALKRRTTARPQGSGQRTAQTAGGDRQGSRPAGTRPAGTQSQRPQGSRPAGASQGQRPQGARPAGTQGQQRPASQGARPSGASQGQQRPASQGARPSGAAQGQQRPASQGQRPQGNRSAQGQQSPGWQSKNFMADEDEFEFEFLNYDGDEQK
ncbi:MAG: SH3 domain-containing protein [Lachnospiraceae bacterium]|nr:SH3 domain-containing protein [Lachnospiraceae bacterium]MCM1238278.1 SH3 domain-containing protein [Lachnospiraceae bacterium]